MTFPSVREPAVELEPVWTGATWRAWGEPLPAPSLTPVLPRQGGSRPLLDVPILDVLTSQWQTSRRVGQQLGVSRFTARDRLEAGVQAGTVDRRREEHGGRKGTATVWYRRKTEAV